MLPHQSYHSLLSSFLCLTHKRHLDSELANGLLDAESSWVVSSWEKDNGCVCTRYGMTVSIFIFVFASMPVYHLCKHWTTVYVAFIVLYHRHDLNFFAQAAQAVARALSVPTLSNSLASPIWALATFCVKKLNPILNKGNIFSSWVPAKQLALHIGVYFCWSLTCCVEGMSARWLGVAWTPDGEVAAPKARAGDKRMREQWLRSLIWNLAENTVPAGLLWEKNTVRLVWWTVTWEGKQPASWSGSDQRMAPKIKDSFYVLVPL